MIDSDLYIYTEEIQCDLNTINEEDGVLSLRTDINYKIDSVGEIFVVDSIEVGRFRYKFLDDKFGIRLMPKSEVLIGNVPNR